MQEAKHLVSYPQKLEIGSVQAFCLNTCFGPHTATALSEASGKQRFVHFGWKRLVWGMARNSIDRVVA